jgi:hypothetical protein
VAAIPKDQRELAVADFFKALADLVRACVPLVKEASQSKAAKRTYIPPKGGA